MHVPQPSIIISFISSTVNCTSFLTWLCTQSVNVMMSLFFDILLCDFVSQWRGVPPLRGISFSSCLVQRKGLRRCLVRWKREAGGQLGPENKWLCCSNSTGFQILAYHRYDSCNYVRFGFQILVYHGYDSCNYVRFGFQMILYHRYDSCNYVRFGFKLYCIIDTTRVIMLGLVSNDIVS